MAMFEGLSEGLFFLLVVAFIAGNVLLAAAVWDRGRFDKVVSIGFAVAALLGILSLLTRFGSGLMPLQAMAVAYPLFQPLARFLTGVWLWPRPKTA